MLPLLFNAESLILPESKRKRCKKEKYGEGLLCIKEPPITGSGGKTELFRIFLNDFSHLIELAFDIKSELELCARTDEVVLVAAGLEINVTVQVVTEEA